MSFVITILAGGLGKRMQSTLPKVLHLIHGVPMLVLIIKQAFELNPDSILIVVGEYKQIISDTVAKFVQDDRINYAVQPIPLGTGDAVKCTLSYLPDNGTNMILNGDTPLLSSDTLRKIKSEFYSHSNELLITSIYVDNPTGNGRIIKNSSGVFGAIVEEKDCNDDQRKINLVNCGIYMATTSTLKKYIPMITNTNAQKEYYLTDIVKLYYADSGKQIALVELPLDKQIEMSNVNTKEQLEALNY